MMRTLLYEAAQVLLTRVTKWSWLKAWAMNVANSPKFVETLRCRTASYQSVVTDPSTKFTESLRPLVADNVTLLRSGTE